MEVQENEVKGSILAVDDNPSNLDLLNRMLTRRKYLVQMVTDGAAALEAVQVRQPDVILLDISMPGMSGYEVSRRLKEDKKTRDIPIIFISALDDLDSKIAAFDAGGVDYVTKPFQFKEVIARVQTQIALRRMQKELALEKKLLEATGNAISDMVILTDCAGKITRCNHAAQERFNVQRDEILGKHYSDFFGDTIRVDLIEPPGAFETIPIVKKEVFFERIDGWFEVTSSPIYFGENMEGYVFTFKDVTSYINAEAKEREAREFAEALHQAGIIINSSLNIDEVLDHILEQIQRVIPHASSNILLCDGDYARVIRMRGYDRYGEEAARRALNAVFDVQATSNLCEMAHSGQPYIIADTRECSDWVQEKTAQEIRSWLGAPIIASSRVIAFIGLDHVQPNYYTVEHAERLSIFAAQASMALENAQLYDEVNKMATVDFLTGLYNRRHFFTLAERESERMQKNDNDLALILLDLDHLKQINSRYGHIVGGQSLQAVGRLCREYLAEEYIAAVYGGDEFAILLPETNIENAFSIADGLRQKVESTPINTYRGKINITITLGVASTEGNREMTLETLIDHADQALFRAKDGGRNRVHIWKA